MSDQGPHKTNIKETLTSVMIAFALAFVFRGFVVEAFLIPTGSMAPTLMGAHLRHTNPQTGYTWPVGPWEEGPLGPAQVQGKRGNTVKVTDPLTMQPMGEFMNLSNRAGDRIFVLKYLYSVYDPERFDVVVFKNPTEPSVNYIKRLLGLPGEQLALVDGDVFVRTPKAGETMPANPWLADGWRLARKPERAQRALWQKIYDSEYVPVGTTTPVYASPWIAGGAGWDMSGGRTFAYSGTGATSLSWDPARPILDRYAYNETQILSRVNGVYPVSDLAAGVGFRPASDGASVAFVLKARGTEFKLEAAGSTITLAMRPQVMADPSGAPSKVEWTTLKTGTLKKPLKAGEVSNLSFWHVDQTLQVFEDDALALEASYDWSINERLSRSLHRGGAWVDEIERDPGFLVGNAGPGGEPKYVAPSVALQFSGGAFTLTRLSLSRDVFYQPALYQGAAGPNLRGHSRSNAPALATAPSSLLSLGGDQFFCCGDNSPASLDGRLWDRPDPWAAKLDPTPGIVHRDLLIGKAFFVYFPAPTWRGPIPVPDFGRMRFIW